MQFSGVDNRDDYYEVENGDVIVYNEKGPSTLKQMLTVLCRNPSGLRCGQR